MKFLRLLLDEAAGRGWRLVAILLLMGIAMAATLMAVNALADRPDRAEIDWRGLLSFVLSAAAVVILQNQSLGTTSSLTEAIIGRMRLRVAALARRSELDGLDRIGVPRIYDTVVRDTTTLSEAASQVIQSLSFVVSAVLVLIYTAVLSVLAFVVIAALTGLWLLALVRINVNGMAAMLPARQEETSCFAVLADILQGFKEAKLHAGRSDDLRDDFARRSRRLHRLKLGAARVINAGIGMATATLYLLVGTSAFALPQYLDDTGTSMKLIYSIMFLQGNCEIILRAIPSLTRINVALDQIDSLEAELNSAAAASRESKIAIPGEFHEVTLASAVYAHKAASGRAGFTVGPCSLSIRPGELIFLVGGNGSGKSTLTRLLTGLYRPDAGAILWDGALVTDDSVPCYRNLFSAVYGDFHLFDRLYGMEHIPPKRVRAVLADLGLAGKTEYSDGAFSTTDLSTGQRKRLAFAVALLEDRPIYVLDELSADQDPDFRHRFYREILPALKARGKAVIAVSHDDRYFDAADRVLWMRDGRLIEPDAGHG